MTKSSRFAVAVHILTLLAIENRNEPTTSEYLACSASTNPVVVRRILGPLRKAGIVTAQSGARGGVNLARHPDQITLVEIYKAVEDGGLFSTGSRAQNLCCVCGRHIEPVLEEAFLKAEIAMEGALADITIAQIASEVEQRDQYHSVFSEARKEF